MKSKILTTTTSEIPGKKVLEILGIVEGNTIRARNIGRDIGAGLKSIVGGEIKSYTQMTTVAREEAFNRMTSQANTLGEEIQALQTLKKATPLTATDIEKQTRIWANKKGKEFKEVITKDMLKGKEGVDSITIVQGLLTGDASKDDGLYQVGTDIIEVINGVPKQAW